jgi:hypothetical protein
MALRRLPSEANRSASGDPFDVARLEAALGNALTALLNWTWYGWGAY